MKFLRFLKIQAQLDYYLFETCISSQFLNTCYIILLDIQARHRILIKFHNVSERINLFLASFLTNSILFSTFHLHNFVNFGIILAIRSYL